MNSLICDHAISTVIKSEFERLRKRFERILKEVKKGTPTYRIEPCHKLYAVSPHVSGQDLDSDNQYLLTNDNTVSRVTLDRLLLLSLWMDNRDVHTTLVKELLTAGADPNWLCPKTKPNEPPIFYGRSALHLAAYNGHVECLELLLNHSANMSVVDENGCTALHLACLAGELASVRLLVDKGLSLFAEDKYGKTCLHLAFDALRYNSESIRFNDNEALRYNFVKPPPVRDSHGMRGRKSDDKKSALSSNSLPKDLQRQSSLRTPSAQIQSAGAQLNGLVVCSFVFRLSSFVFFFFLLSGCSFFFFFPPLFFVFYFSLWLTTFSLFLLFFFLLYFFLLSFLIGKSS